MGSETCAVNVMDEGSQPFHRRMLPDIFTDVKPTPGGVASETAGIIGVKVVSMGEPVIAGISVRSARLGVAVKPPPIKVGVPVNVGVGIVAVRVAVSLGVT